MEVNASAAGTTAVAAPAATTRVINVSVVTVTRANDGSATTRHTYAIDHPLQCGFCASQGGTLAEPLSEPLSEPASEPISEPITEPIVEPNCFHVLPDELIALVLLGIDRKCHLTVKLTCKSFAVCLRRMYAPAAATHHKAGASASLALVECAYRTKTSLFAMSRTPTLVAWAAALVVADFVNDDWEVRRLAVWFLGALGADAVALHGGALIHMLLDEHWSVSLTAKQMLGRLEPEALSRYASVFVRKLTHPRCIVRHSALTLMGKMQPTTLAVHARAVARMTRDREWSVRRRAMETLGELEPKALALHANTVVRALGDSEYRVRFEAENALRKLDQSAIRLTRDAASRLLAVNTHETVWDSVVRCWVYRSR